MKKKQKTLIILLCVAIGLVGGYLGLSSYNKAQNSASAQASAEKVMFALNDGESVTKLSYTGSTDGALAFSDAGGVWTYDADSAFAVDQDTLTSMSGVFSSLTAQKIIADNSADASKYGLDNPQCTVSITTSEGRTLGLKIGGLNTATNDYYAMLDGNDKIYSIPKNKGKYFFSPLLDVASKSLTPSYSQISYVKLRSAADEFTVSHDENGIAIGYNDDVKWYVTGKDGVNQVSSSTVAGTYESAAFESTLAKCVAYKPTAEELNSYGITETSPMVEMKYIPQTAESGTDASASAEASAETPDPVTVTVQYGSSYTEEITAKSASASASAQASTGTTASYTYLYSPDRQMVYAMSTEDTAKIVNAVEDDAVSKAVYSLSLVDIDSYEVSAGGVTHTLELVRGTTTNSKGASVETVTGYKLDGTQYDSGSDTYNAILGMYYNLAYIEADEVAPGNPAAAGEPYLTAVFQKRTGDMSKVTVQYYEYDSNFYLAKVNGEGGYLVNKQYVKTAADGVINLAPQS